MTDPDLQEALARNLRYLEIVEEHDLCPFAQRCRQEGNLDRRVLPLTVPDATPILEAIADLHREPHAHVEVALLILPRLSITYSGLSELAGEVRMRMKAAGLQEFFIVAFHPDAPVDTSTPERLVSLLRRSPDPTFQLVRASLLERVRGGSNDTRWVDLKMTDLRAPPPVPPPSLSERIASQNAETVQRLGADRLVELLAALRK